MAVPKRKTTPSKRDQRRAHDALTSPTFTVNKSTGELQRPHHISIDGYYGDRQIIKKKNKTANK